MKAEELLDECIRLRYELTQKQNDIDELLDALNEVNKSLWDTKINLLIQKHTKK